MSNIYLDQKNTALANVEDDESKKLQLEDASITTTLAALSPSHPSYAKLQTRQTTIRAAVAAKK
jgi:hypothetical protein